MASPFNDVFDASLDAVERPERPIPSGRASLTGAVCLGLALLLGGTAAAVQVSAVSGGLAIAIALSALPLRPVQQAQYVPWPY